MHYVLITVSSFAQYLCENTDPLFLYFIIQRLGFFMNSVFVIYKNQTIIMRLDKTNDVARSSEIVKSSKENYYFPKIVNIVIGKKVIGK